MLKVTVRTTIKHQWSSVR